MKLFRVFDWDGTSQEAQAGGPLYVPRQIQGPGRFDVPHLDGAMYLSLSEIGAIAEILQGFRTRRISNRHFQRPDGRQKAIAEFELTDAQLIDLDDSKTLVRLGIQPSQVITHNREVTHPLAERLFKEGADGLLWPSSIEGEWKNACLFAARVGGKLRMAGKIRRLSITLPALKETAVRINLNIAKVKRRGAPRG